MNSITEIDRNPFEPGYPIHEYTIRCESAVEGRQNERFYWFANVRVWNSERPEFKNFCPKCKSEELINATKNYKSDSFRLWAERKDIWVCMCCNPLSDDENFIQNTVWINKQNEKRVYDFTVEKSESQFFLD